MISTDQQDRILQRIVAVWPSVKLTTDHAREWRAELGPKDYEQACAALARLKRTSTFAPSLAEFADAYRAQRRPEAWTPAPADPPAAPDVRAAGLSRARQILKTAKHSTKETSNT